MAPPIPKNVHAHTRECCFIYCAAWDGTLFVGFIHCHNFSHASLWNRVVRPVNKMNQEKWQQQKFCCCLLYGLMLKDVHSQLQLNIK
jgi:hypothetical protein